MKTKPLIQIAAAWLVWTLNLQPSAALASTNRVGVITANYTMSASGSGARSSAIPGVDSLSAQDQAQVSITGQAQYEMLQTQTNLIIGKLIRSSAQQTASGSLQEADWDSVYGNSTSSFIYIADPSFNHTNICDHGQLPRPFGPIHRNLCEGSV